MKILDGNVEIIAARNILVFDNNEGLIICSCGKEYEYDKKFDENVAECYGKIVPVCPDCKGVPDIKT